MTVAEFIAKWRHVDLKERSAAQEHFLDLCHLLGHPTPAEADPTGERFCFEKGIAKHGGGDGFADVWKKGFFGWEYKGKHKDLNAAYNQLLLYRDALASPPLLVLCDLDRIIVHTNFTNTVSARHEIALEQVGEPRNIEILRAVFFDPEKLRPGQTSEAVTRMAAEQIAGIADSMRQRSLDAASVAHFLDRVVFCLFAEDIGLLPSQLFTRIAESAGSEPATFRGMLSGLFANMSTGGYFGVDRIRHFNGSLFDSTEVPDLTADEVKRIVAAVRLDWSAVDPSIFGTLFERGLDPAKRSQLGAHFTGKEDIRTLVDAVVMTPLRREWDETRQTVTNLLATGKKSMPPVGVSSTPTPAQAKKAGMEAASLIHAFLTRLQNVKVLDPSCGSGNFLYVSLQALKDLEKEAIVFSMDNGLGSFIPLVGPWQLFGIEINPYAHDLAQMTVWIGWLQWIRLNGFGSPNEPILRAIPGNFQCRDSILDLTDPANPKEPEWPRVDFIVGNPPFLGDKMMRRELGDTYVETLRTLYDGRIPGQSDLCCYWFEKARAAIADGGCKRAGLLATQGIRGGANREVLNAIKKSGDIFFAESDRPWVLDGANVHVSMVGFDCGLEQDRVLDGKAVADINSNLTAGANVTATGQLRENRGVCFIGTTKKAPLDIDDALAHAFLLEPNPNGLPSSDVIVPYLNADAVTNRTPRTWIIDFPVTLSESNCEGYAVAFEYVRRHVLPLRVNHREAVQQKYWWRLARPCPELRERLQGLDRFLVTTIVSKHRLFAWQTVPTNPDHTVGAFTRSDDLFFGILHSHIHEVWALRMGTRLETRPRYTPSTCFETYPFPNGVLGGSDLASVFPDIATAAQELNGMRECWLNPPDWTRVENLTFPGTVGGLWNRYIDPATVEERNGVKIGTVCYPRPMPRDAECERRLKDRTLTKLYNERPAWLDTAHRKLDAAVAAAYGLPADLADEQILERLLALNLERAKA